MLASKQSGQGNTARVHYLAQFYSQEFPQSGKNLQYYEIDFIVKQLKYLYPAFLAIKDNSKRGQSFPLLFMNL